VLIDLTGLSLVFLARRFLKHSARFERPDPRPYVATATAVACFRNGIVRRELHDNISKIGGARRSNFDGGRHQYRLVVWRTSRACRSWREIGHLVMVPSELTVRANRPRMITVRVARAEFALHIQGYQKRWYNCKSENGRGGEKFFGQFASTAPWPEIQLSTERQDFDWALPVFA
jgi:hypothetical protein